MNPIEKLTSLGQSLWLDNIQRKILENGELKAMIERGDIRRVTSNPTIFQNAIAKTNDYDAALVPLSWGGWNAEKIFWQLAIEYFLIIRRPPRSTHFPSTTLFRFVSIEVS